MQSFYDYDTQTIGPYKIPVDIEYKLSEQSNAFSVYRYYEIMNRFTEALAVFNNNNFCVCILTPEYLRFEYLTAYEATHNRFKLPIIKLDTPIVLNKYEHVGWIKTYQQCQAVYHWPWMLLGDTETKEIYDFSDKLSGHPLVNPPLSLYKLLVDTDYNAVFYDLDTCSPVFIK